MAEFIELLKALHASPFTPIMASESVDVSDIVAAMKSGKTFDRNTCSNAARVLFEKESKYSITSYPLDHLDSSVFDKLQQCIDNDRNELTIANRCCSSVRTCPQMIFQRHVLDAIRASLAA